MSQYINRDKNILSDILNAINDVNKDFCVIAKINGKSREKMLETLQNAIDTIDEEKFAKTFRRDHI